MKKILLLFSFILIVASGCDFVPQQENIIIWRFETREQLAIRGVGGYANPSEDGKKPCMITTERPTNVNDLELWEIIVHEVRHCKEGAFHR